MHLAVISHKLCWTSRGPSGFATDGGFTLQLEAISELFDRTTVVVPVSKFDRRVGILPLKGQNISVASLSAPQGTGLSRKLLMPFWLLKNCRRIWSAIKKSDAVHALIPGDVGTIGLVFALLQKKPLFVRHCGNWLVQRTVSERFVRRLMERFAGGRNVMLATGGTNNLPSKRNPNIKWVYSTSLREEQLKTGQYRELPGDGRIRLIIACRQEKLKGADIVIASMPHILNDFPAATLHVVGAGSFLSELKELARALNVDGHVIFHGQVDQRRVIELLKDSHVFCFPTSASEGFPKAVVEALAFGIPVITTKVSVLPKLVKNGCGILLDVASAEALADAVGTICSNSAKYREMSTLARDTALGYSLENWRDHIGEILMRSWKSPSLSAKSE